jgi:hypothetical protein
LSSSIKPFDDPETGQPSHKQALMQAGKLEATTPYNLEIQNFIANRLWALGVQDEATEVYERAYKQALVHIPKGFKGQITWSAMDNRPFLRLAHGTLLGLMRRRGSTKGGRSRHEGIYERRSQFTDG